jgi:hypothetical protein
MSELFGSDPQDFAHYAQNLPDPYALNFDSSDDESNHNSDNNSDSGSYSGADDSDAGDSDAYDTEEDMIRQWGLGHPKYHYRALQHFRDARENRDNPDYRGFDYDWSTTDWTESDNNSDVDSTDSADSFHSAHSSLGSDDEAAPDASNVSDSDPEENQDYSHMLGPDNRLMESEKDRRWRLSLCFYCGGKHLRVNCPKLRAKLGYDAGSESSSGDESSGED